MSDEFAVDEVMEDVITHALETRHAPVMPLDFAARVRLALPERPLARTRSTVGRPVAMVAATVLLVLLFAIAPQTSESWTNIPMYVELVVLAQLGMLAYFLSLKKI